MPAKEIIFLSDFIANFIKYPSGTRPESYIRNFVHCHSRLMPETPAKISAGEASCDGFGRACRSLKVQLIKTTTAERSSILDVVESRASG